MLLHPIRVEGIEFLHGVINLSRFGHDHGAPDPCADGVGLRHQQVVGRSEGFKEQAPGEGALDVDGLDGGLALVSRQAARTRGGRQKTLGLDDAGAVRQLGFLPVERHKPPVRVPARDRAMR